MGIGNILVFAQVVFFFCVFFLSFFFYIPMSVNVGDFKGNCLLNADGKWERNQSAGDQTAQLQIVQWGSQGSCNFAVFIGVIEMILGAIYVVWESMHLCKGTDSLWLEAFITCMVCCVVMVMVFAAALTISSGFQVWCALLLKPGSEIHSCEQGQYIPFASELGLNTSRYFTDLQIAQFGAWSSWFCWVALSMLAIVKIYRYSKQEAFLTSMNQERERLLQRLGPPSEENI
ncbi:transmembrane protein 179-like [Liolophura sinensis]|uniref:transmembrane protein 179-like n=1 Tax=Liolophura sinensis TaxID=3198878 RepID=UPI003158F3F5